MHTTIILCMCIATYVYKDDYAAGCCKTHKDVSLFQFPRDHQLRLKWLKNWCSGPGSVAGSVLCSAHFEKSCLSYLSVRKKPQARCSSYNISENPPKHSQVLRQLQATGTSKRKTTDTELPGNEPKRDRSAYEKRERLRVWFSYTS